MIRLRNLAKHFRQGESEVRGLDGVDLDVATGEFLTVMGPSGSGKSTLLQLIGGLDVPSAGEVTVDGRLLSRLTDDEITILRRRRIGFVFQLFNLLPTLTAEENVALPLVLDGRRMRDVRPRVEQLLELVGLAHRRHHRPGALSGGEMQRVAIARALVNDPALVLADEPTGSLDSQSGEHVLDIIRRGVATTDRTIVLVTHDERIAASGDRTIVLRDGRIVSETRHRRTDRTGSV
jgi:putative ABC transport system ATP-binding protein